MMTAIEETKLVDQMCGPVQRMYEAGRRAYKVWLTKNLELTDIAMQEVREAGRAYLEFLHDTERELR